MAKKSKKGNIAWLIPEGQTRESHDYHYSFYKRKSVEKKKFKKYNPVSRKHEIFIEVKAPSHSK